MLCLPRRHLFCITDKKILLWFSFINCTVYCRKQGESIMYCWNIYFFPFVHVMLCFFCSFRTCKRQSNIDRNKKIPDSVTLVHPTDEFLLSNIDGARLFFLEKNIRQNYLSFISAKPVGTQQQGLYFYLRQVKCSTINFWKSILIIRRDKVWLDKHKNSFGLDIRHCKTRRIF